MKNKFKKLLPIIKGFAFCGIALQIVLGILYMAGNMMTRCAVGGSVNGYQRLMMYLFLETSIHGNVHSCVSTKIATAFGAYSCQRQCMAIC